MTEPSDLAYALSGYGKRTNPYDARRKLALSQIQQGSDTSPVQSPWQGAARLAQALAGGLGLITADQGEQEADKKRSDALAQAMAEPDPQKRIGLIAAYDPDAGARAAGALAVEQAKIKAQKDDTYGRADAYGIAPPGAPQVAGTAPQGSAPPGFSYNSGNIRVSDAAWNGKGQPYNGFETFDSPQAGANAHFQNYVAYAKQNPNMTVGEALTKWSPPNENNTQAIVSRVAQAGIDPRMPLTSLLQNPQAAARLMMVQTMIEKGGIPQGFTPDVFMRAATPGGAQPIPNATPGEVQPQPIPNAAPGQAQIQPAAGPTGAPPAPNPAQVNGPTLSAPPAPPQRLSVDQAPREMLAPFVQRLRMGAYGYGPEAEIKMRTEAQAALDRKYDTDKLVYEQQQGDYRANRDQALKQPQENVQNESKLREQFDNLQNVKDYRKANTIFRNAVQAAKDPTAAGDLNLVYAFATMMDPGSVVREGEMGMVRATQNASDQVKALVNAVSGGQRISPDARRALVDQMSQRYEAYKSAHDELADAFGGIAERSGMKRENVVVPLGGVEWRRKEGGKSGLDPGVPVYDINGKPVRR